MFISFNVCKLQVFFWFDPLLNVHKKQSSNKRILKEIVREGRLQWTRKHANLSWRTTLSGWIRWGHLHRYCLVKLRSVIKQRPHDWEGGKRARYIPGDGIQVYNEEESFILDAPSSLQLKFVRRPTASVNKPHGDDDDTMQMGFITERH